MDDPEKNNAVLAYEIESFTLLGIALLVVALRTGSRIKLVGIRHFEADDYLVLVGAVRILTRALGPSIYITWVVAHLYATY